MASISRQSKETQERHRRILAQLLKLPENAECMDCRARNPTWASTNLGVFLCIRCSGLHRQVGVHITKVKSCTMDLWDPEQVSFICRMGNARAKKIFEEKLPKDYGKPSESEDSGLVLQWIRSKYERKLYWCGSENASKHMQEFMASPLITGKESNGPSQGIKRGSRHALTQQHAASRDSPSSPVEPSPTEGNGGASAGQPFPSIDYNEYMSPFQSPRGPHSPSMPSDNVPVSTAFPFVNMQKAQAERDGGEHSKSAGSDVASPASSAFDFIQHGEQPAQAPTAPTEEPCEQQVPTTAPDSASGSIATSAFDFIQHSEQPAQAPTAPTEEQQVPAPNSASGGTATSVFDFIQHNEQPAQVPAPEPQPTTAASSPPVPAAAVVPLAFDPFADITATSRTDAPVQEEKRSTACQPHAPQEATVQGSQSAELHLSQPKLHSPVMAPFTPPPLQQPFAAVPDSAQGAALAQDPVMLERLMQQQLHILQQLQRMALIQQQPPVNSAAC